MQLPRQALPLEAVKVNYRCATASVTIIVLANDGKESGTRLTLGPSGVTFKLK
jgi:hypothetical protein